MGLFGGWVAPYAYDDYDIVNRLIGPSVSHPFGIDVQGRDVLSRVIFGARTSILIGFGAVAIAATAASTIGTTSGYYGGLFDLLFQRLVDVIHGLPGLIFIIFVVSIVGANTGAIIAARGVLFAPGSSRIVRAQVISVKQNDYLLAARSGNDEAPVPGALPRGWPSPSRSTHSTCSWTGSATCSILACAARGSPWPVAAARRQDRLAGCFYEGWSDLQVGQRGGRSVCTRCRMVSCAPLLSALVEGSRFWTRCMMGNLLAGGAAS